jgi:hypothetical protein
MKEGRGKISLAASLTVMMREATAANIQGWPGTPNV